MIIWKTSQTFFERPPNDKRSPRPKQTDSTQGYCPTPQNSPTNVQMNSAAAAVSAKLHQTKIWGILPDKRKVPHGWPECLRRQPPRVAFKNNDIYVVDDDESSNMKNKRRGTPRSNIN